jgi:hypothetical protein
MDPTSYAESGQSSSHGSWLAYRVVVALLFVANGFGVFLALARREELLAQYPGIDAWWPIYAACPFVSLAALVLAWRKRRIGVLVALAVGVLVLGIELRVSGFAIHVARLPIAMGALAWTAYRMRARLR